MKLFIPPPLYGLLFFAAMWWLDKLVPQFSFYFMGQLSFAIIIGLMGLAIDIIAIISFLKTKTTINPLAPQNTNSIVTTGLYRYSRNPMYVGLFCLLVAAALWLGNILNVFLLLIFLFLITVFQIKPEEAILAKKFGASYQHYCQRVRRWL